MISRNDLRARQRTRGWSRVRLAGALSLALAATGCQLDLSNPNSPTEEEVLSNVEGVIALAVGMQGQFAGTVDDYATTASLVTDEWGTQSLALLSHIVLFTGEGFDNTYLTVERPWSGSYLTIKSANTLLSGVDDVPLSAGFRSGISGLAKLMKAMAFGSLIMNYEEVPIDISVAGPVPEPRDVVLDTILVLLESARADLEAVPTAELATFRTRVVGSNFDVENTINAMLARYYLMDGQYAEAVTAADRVDLGVLSVFSYPVPGRNPIENLAFQLRYVGGLQSFVDEAEPGDQRPTYWVNAAAAPLAANPPDSVIKPLAQYSDPQDPYPAYLPDEVRLIKAEALARQGQFGPAADLVNAVRMQTSSAVDEPIAGFTSEIPAANLDSEDELLDQIAYERRYELYMQGLRWEDTRRLGTARTTVPTLEFLPIPNQECLANPSSPCID